MDNQDEAVQHAVNLTIRRLNAMTPDLPAMYDHDRTRMITAIVAGLVREHYIEAPVNPNEVAQQALQQIGA